MGELETAVRAELCASTGLNVDLIDPDTTAIHLDTTTWDLTMLVLRVARRIGWQRFDGATTAGPTTTSKEGP